jgi:uncharacterized protein YlxP (DUF503 family)
MFVGTARLEFHIPGSASLKAKRSVVQGLKQRITNRFNVSVAELDHLDLWQRTAIGVAVISNERAVVDRVLTEVMRLCESDPRAVLVDFSTEIR